MGLPLWYSDTWGTEMNITNETVPARGKTKLFTLLVQFKKPETLIDANGLSSLSVAAFPLQFSAK